MSWTVYIKNGSGITVRNRFKAYLKAKELGDKKFISVFNNESSKHKVYSSLKELENDIKKEQVK